MALHHFPILGLAQCTLFYQGDFEVGVPISRVQLGWEALLSLPWHTGHGLAVLTHAANFVVLSSGATFG